MLDRVAFTGEASAVIEQAKITLLAVLERVHDWPTDQEWPSLLPESFVSACAPEQTSEEYEQWLARWRQLSPRDRGIEEERTSWSLLNWLYWFDPSGGAGDRTWTWWDNGSDADDAGWIDIEIFGWPYGSGELRWLLRACGATSIAPSA